MNWLFRRRHVDAVKERHMRQFLRVLNDVLWDYRGSGMKLEEFVREVEKRLCGTMQNIEKE